MQIIGISQENNDLRERFFRRLYGKNEGWVAVAIHTKEAWKEQCFRYPQHLPRIIEYINRNYFGSDVYFCPQLLRDPGGHQTHNWRRADNVERCPNLWADLDTCDPRIINPAPSVVVQSSPGKWHAYWLLKEPIAPLEAADLSHRIAFKYAAQGADKSGWDLSQVLRVPKTYNMKYADTGDVPVVELDDDLTTFKVYDPDEFRTLPTVPGYEYLDEPFPDEVVAKLPDADTILESYAKRLDYHVGPLFTTEPNSDWSSKLWRLECFLLESGMTREEAFVVSKAAACNKYARDNRQDLQLWKEICKAANSVEEQTQTLDETVHIEPLLNPGEEIYDSIIDRFVRWAKSRSDAAEEYWLAGGFTILSALIADSLVIPTAPGDIIPNLWFMLLGDTTLTRKSVSMDIAMDIIKEIDRDVLLATDGSVEGIFTAMSTRTRRASLFHVDEFSSLLSRMAKKDYMAGMVEGLTKLYDGRSMRRRLAKGDIDVIDPVFLFLAGGIRTRILELLPQDYIINGFVPRFLFVQGEPDMERYRPLGPPTHASNVERDELIRIFRDLHARYQVKTKIKLINQSIEQKQRATVVLSDEVWQRYNTFETELMTSASSSTMADLLTPVANRLAISTLKIAALLAAIDSKPPEIRIEMPHLLKAISYAEVFRRNAVQVVLNTGKNAQERVIERIFSIIKKREGVGRDVIMRAMKNISPKEMDTYIATLEQRREIKRDRRGPTERYYATV